MQTNTFDKKGDSTSKSAEHGNTSFVNSAQNNSAKTKSNLIEIPSITLPKGGGAIKSIDEKFSVNAANGTAGFSIPLPFSPGRNGFTPQLSLSYNSGGGNSIFGLGWSCDYPAIQRKTEKKLPEYKDAEESDTFIFSGAEDLVPELNQDPNSNIIRYRPRIEGLFARIEKINDSGNIYWRIRTKENVVSVFGQDNEAKLFSPLPGEENKIFKWCLEYSYDDKGNFIRYFYKKENKENIPDSLSEKNRLNDIALFTNVYLKKILYGNKIAFYEGNNVDKVNDFMFELIFDFGEHNKNQPTTLEDTEWQLRADPFSDYRSGFEIRTYRLCQRVLMFHHFKEELGLDDYLVRSVDFTYDEQPHLTYLEEITQTGYIWNMSGLLKSKRSLPPLEFTYVKPGYSREVKEITRENSVHDPVGLDNQFYHWTDLYSEGISGILSEQATGWFYKTNLGDGKFTPAKLVSQRPSFTGLSSGTLSIQELEANGKKYFVSSNDSLKGFSELTAEEEWKSFTAFQKFPNINLNDPNLKFLDLNGDGMPDLLISHEQEFIWYSAKGKIGYDDYQLAAKARDEEKGPKILFANNDERILVATADMSGDGLSDIIIVTNSSVCYYPNLGYGLFGARVTMQMNGTFDSVTGFNPRYIQLADIDGSGTTDIVYTGKNKIQVWFNQSGNNLKEPDEFFNPFPEINNQAKISFVDLLGNGTSCLVWSSALPSHGNAPLRYIDLMNGKKPHVMEKYINNLGKEITLHYKSSTQYYLDDKKAGKKWITKLPFPVQCVSKVLVEDKISKTRFTNEYIYHHGFYDACYEREFRGFAMVEKKDSEQYEHYVEQTVAAGAVNIIEQHLFQPVVTTKTWFHTGAFLNREKIFHLLRDEYYPDALVKSGEITDAEVIATLQQHLLSEAPLPDDLSGIDEIIECCSALKGLPLRQEIYSDEGDSEIQKHPYSVKQHNYEIQLFQHKAEQKHAVFLSHKKETLIFNYERNPLDPRIAHTINIDIDKYGNVLESASIVYPRKKTDTFLPDETQQEQGKTVIIYTKNSFTNEINGLSDYRLPLPYQVKTYELKGVAKTDIFYRPDNFENILEGIRSTTAAYNELDKPLTGGKAQKRLIEHVKTLFLDDDLSGPLPLGIIKPKALPYENYQLAYTPALLNNIFNDKASSSELRDLMTEGKFVHTPDEDGNTDNNWWIPSGTMNFKKGLETTDTNPKKRFYLPVSYVDPFDAETKVEYDNYFFAIIKTENVFENESSCSINYRTLSPARIVDVNRNVSEAMFDELGLVKAMAVIGKDDDGDGVGEADDLRNLFEYNTPADASRRDAFLVPAKKFLYNPLDVDTDALLKHAAIRFIYDLDCYRNTGKPVVAAAIAREEHYKKNKNSPLQLSFEYSNGSGQVIMKKMQAEPGIAKKSNGDGTATDIDTSPFLRWIGNGRTIVNNKSNKPVKHYEPYFSTTHQFEDEKELVEAGVTPIMYYDALSRLIKTEMPDKTFSRTEFDSWKQIIYDQNDTVLGSAWHAEHIASSYENEKKAAEKATKHADTPVVQYFDSLGRSVLMIENNGNDASGIPILYNTRTELDVEGNLRKVIDARRNPVMQYNYDMLGNPVYQKSMDAGQRWMLLNIAGKPLCTWDERDHKFQYFYDKVQRPSFTKVIGGDGASLLNNVFDKIIYGEDLLFTDGSNRTELQDKNFLGNVYRHFDTSGLLETTSYDFKNQPESTTRKLFSKYKEITNWTAINLQRINRDSIPDLEEDDFTFQTETDALGRITKQIAPDESVITPAYTERGMLNSETVEHKTPSATIAYIKKIEYNEKGQRGKIIYGNDVTTIFNYDKNTFRLISLTTRRKNNSLLQDLQYTYDPVGNITHIQDNAIPTLFYSNMRIEPVCEYTYDPLYRLRLATGRENDAALDFDSCDNWNDKPFIHEMNSGDPMEIHNYTQSYDYDSVGNILQMKHLAAGNGWTRNYQYEANNNRLKSTQAGQSGSIFNYVQYEYHSKHGFMTKLPHLEKIDWNFKEEVVITTRQHCTDDSIPVITYYQYDSQGQRIRKITENQSSVAGTITKKEERIYIAGYEVYKKHSGTNIGLERESISLMDDGHRFVTIETRNDIDDGTTKRLIRYQLHNHIGSVCLEIDNSIAGKVISYEEYHPYGTTAFLANNGQIKAASKRYRYSGKERDEETGLYYYGARYYLGWLGRWMNSDPGGLIDGPNTYRFSRDNPIKFLDSSGFQGAEFSDPLSYTQYQFNQVQRDVTDFGMAAIEGYGIGSLGTLLIIGSPAIGTALGVVGLAGLLTSGAPTFVAMEEQATSVGRLYSGGTREEMLQSIEDTMCLVPALGFSAAAAIEGKLGASLVLGESEIGGAAAASRFGFTGERAWRTNPGGIKRTPAEGMEILKKAGIEPPENATFKIVPQSELTNTKGARAEYGLQTSGPGNKEIDFETYFKIEGNQDIRILLSEDLLVSDEALIAHAIHEGFEVKGLVKIFENNDFKLKYSVIDRLVNAHDELSFGQPNKNLHWQAWEVADTNTLTCRKNE